MANEATVITKYGENGGGKSADYIVSSSTTIPQHTLLVQDAVDGGAIAHSTINQTFVGIANAEKSDTDTSARLGAYQDVEFTMAASGAIARGKLVKLSTVPNFVEVATDADVTSSEARIVGRATSTAASSLVNVRVNL